jgi:small subunit ribosomal protein S18
MKGSIMPKDKRAFYRRKFGRRKVCKFCVNPDMVIDYKNPDVIRPFVTDRGKIIPRRITGNCSKHQRQLTVAIKRARHLALVPFTVTGRD